MVHSVTNSDSRIFCTACLTWGSLLWGWASGGFESCHQAGCVLPIFRMHILFIPSEEWISQGGRKRCQTGVVQPADLPELLSLWCFMPTSGALRVAVLIHSGSFPTPLLTLALCVSAHPFSNYLLTKKATQSSSTNSYLSQGRSQGCSASKQAIRVCVVMFHAGGSSSCKQTSAMGLLLIIR